MSSTAKGNPPDKGKSRVERSTLPPPSYASYAPGASRQGSSTSGLPPPPSYATYAPNIPKAKDASQPGPVPPPSLPSRPSQPSQARSTAKGPLPPSRSSQQSQARSTAKGPLPPSHVTQSPNAASNRGKAGLSTVKENADKSSTSRREYGQTALPQKASTLPSKAPEKPTITIISPSTSGLKGISSALEVPKRTENPELSVYSEAQVQSKLNKSQDHRPALSQQPRSSSSSSKDPRLISRSSAQIPPSPSKDNQGRTLRADPRSSYSRDAYAQSASKQTPQSNNVQVAVQSRAKTYYHEDPPEDYGRPTQAGALVPYQGGSRLDEASHAQNVVEKYKGEQSRIPDQKGQMVTVPRYRPLKKGQLSPNFIKALCRVCKTDESEVGAWCGANVMLWDVQMNEYCLDALWEYLGIPQSKWVDHYQRVETARDHEDEKAFKSKNRSLSPSNSWQAPMQAPAPIIIQAPPAPAPAPAAAAGAVSANATAQANAPGVGFPGVIGGPMIAPPFLVPRFYPRPIYRGRWRGGGWGPWLAIDSHALPYW